jgi:hypothetical protein
MIDLLNWPYVLTPYEEGAEVLAQSLFAGTLLGLESEKE